MALGESFVCVTCLTLVTYVALNNIAVLKTTHDAKSAPQFLLLHFPVLCTHTHTHTHTHQEEEGEDESVHDLDVIILVIALVGSFAQVKCFTLVTRLTPPLAAVLEGGLLCVSCGVGQGGGK